MAYLWNLIFLSGIVSLANAWLTDNIDCSQPHHSEWIKNYCARHQQSSSHGQHTSNTDDFGCNRVDYKDRVNLLWKDWLANGDDEVVIQLYAEIMVSLQSDHANSLPGSDKRSSFRSKRRTVHDEAYYHHDTVPDYQHVRNYVFNTMNSKCRIEILDEIKRTAPHLFQKATTVMTHRTTKATAAPVTQKQTAAPTTTNAPKTTVTTTSAPTRAAVTTSGPTSPQVTTAEVTDPALPQMLNTSYSCDLLKFVTALAHNDLLQDPNAGMCTDGTHTQSEALISKLCNVPVISQWKQGVNVMSNCKRIKPYTPIAMFVFGTYVTSGTELAGILVECTADGFKAAFQLCGHSPRIYNLKHGATDNRQDANRYYVIE